VNLIKNEPKFMQKLIEEAKKTPQTAFQNKKEK
jgi:hypothetical protein